ncbi:uncharacterized protein CEXT_810111 [Caerostris extrusa]|uniref:Uncharacterized protein n=1 Tax=Caerostris extrusa TaxID=172846 RepID=A0AAV4W2S4_CAEEX|nr:uncharacterized protein CEXT_810111 [Caerostris extrusa]
MNYVLSSEGKKQVFERIIEERIKREENERLEKENERLEKENEKQRQIEIEEREKRRQMEIEENEKQRQMEIEEREKQRTFELKKLKLQNENKVMYQTSTEYDTNAPENKKEISLSVIDHESSVTADKYLRKATINNRSVSCLLDTGASSCLFKESLAEHLGINMTPCKKDLYSFGNQKCPVLQSLGAAVVDFQIGEVVGNDIPVLIVPDSAQPVDLLVGRTF